MCFSTSRKVAPASMPTILELASSIQHLRVCRYLSGETSNKRTSGPIPVVSAIACYRQLSCTRTCAAYLRASKDRRKLFPVGLVIL